MVMDFTLLPNWYDQFKENYVEHTIRGELYADSSKSRYSNTDNNMNIRCDVNSGIKKGDMLIASNNGDVFILDWEVALQHNNAPSRAVRCNFNLIVERYTQEQTDDLGYVIKPEGWTTIVDELPANAYFYDGRNASFYAANSNPGIAPEVNALITVQFNEQTKNLKIGDEFMWGNDKYIITDISYVGVNRAGTSGTLALQSLQKPGGIE